MRKLTRAASAALGLCIFASPVVANDLGILSPGALEATIVGSSDVVVHVPQTGERAITIAPIDITNVTLVNAYPGSGQSVDMSGGDGSLRSCYANGGIAKQGQDFVYRCEFDPSSGAGPLSQQSAYVTPANSDTGYSGATNVEDPALLDCMGRGGSLIQLSSNGQYACAM